MQQVDGRVTGKPQRQHRERGTRVLRDRQRGEHKKPHGEGHVDATPRAGAMRESESDIHAGCQHQYQSAKLREPQLRHQSVRRRRIGARRGQGQPDQGERHDYAGDDQREVGISEIRH